jgi:hypothetical protein
MKSSHFVMVVGFISLSLESRHNSNTTHGTPTGGLEWSILRVEVMLLWGRTLLILVR